ncbi:SsgA family sporulation/cell division regulator [Streptomyces sp. A7024]|uniref:SsgA family sporulation/cell division regulator n=1 Tax=Streptomyces coryli TaxID=1128680 RepID=A0A6G4U981_9ACTN|nr:SsgA family sporulation/cell division regulator [Streptomyces coryli]NGN67867.1 SsgA family sporulation/cell division regulator [Streptomyces coryli]
MHTDRTNHTEHTEVERELELRLVLSPGRSIGVPARLSYRTADPYAVHVTFHVGSAAPVNWTFARELMVEGVFRPCGHGDVRVWPTKVDDRSVVCMALSSPDGDALLEAPAPALSAWLERTLRVVPPGEENNRIAMDEALAELLAPAPRDDLWLRDPWPSDESPAREQEQE